MTRTEALAALERAVTEALRSGAEAFEVRDALVHGCREADRIWMADRFANLGPWPAGTRCSLDAAAFARALDVAARVAEKTTPIEILKHVRLHAQTGQLEVAATDMEMAVRTSVPADVAEPGVMVLPAGQLAGLVRTLDGAVQMDEAKDFWLHVACGGSAVKLAGLDPQDYPNLVDVPAEMVTIPAAVLLPAIGRVLFIVEKRDSSSYPFVRLLADKGRLSVSATDGHRMAVSYGQSDFDLDVWLAPALARLLLDLDADGPVQLAATDERVFAVAGGVTAAAMKPHGIAPNLDNAFRLARGYSEVTVPAADLKSALRRIGVVARNSDKDKGVGVEFDVTKDGVLLKANGSTGQIVETLTPTANGELGRMGFELAYLAQFLATTDAEAVTLCHGGDNERHVQWWPADGKDSHRYLLAQRRL